MADGQSGASAMGDAQDEASPLGNDIVVVATRLKGQVVAPQPPIVTLDEEDIAAYGAASINDLIAQHQFAIIY
jgi:outer membrane cobalamin receptor